MIVPVLIYIKHHCPSLWHTVEWINGLLFRLFHPSMRKTAATVLRDHEDPCYRFALLERDDVEALAGLLNSQPDEALAYFQPHAFDPKTLRRLQRNPAFVMMKVFDRHDGTMVGYFFLRCFFIGRAFHGLLVDAKASGHGIGTAQWMLASKICAKERLRMFATISSSNMASCRSCERATDVSIVERMANGYLLVECKEKK